MRLFRRSAPAPAPPPKASAPAAPPPPPWDKRRGYPPAGGLRDELAEGRWEHVHEVLEAETDPTVRDLLVEALADIEGRPTWLDEWVAARPGTASPLLVRGRHSVNWGWQARGGGRAGTVSDDGWRLLRERCALAEDDLLAAAAIRPDDAAPHVNRLWAAMGSGGGIGPLNERFRAVVSRDPLSISGHQSMVVAVTKKWFGSHDQMFGLARTSAARAPEGHSLNRLVAVAHLERWLAMSTADEEKAEAGAYWKREEVRAEVLAAHARLFDAGEFRAGPRTPEDASIFLACMHLMGNRETRPRLVELLGDSGPLAYGWQFIRGSSASWTKVVTEVREGGGVATGA